MCWIFFFLVSFILFDWIGLMFFRFSVWWGLWRFILLGLGLVWWVLVMVGLWFIIWWFSLRRLWNGWWYVVLLCVLRRRILLRVDLRCWIWRLLLIFCCFRCWKNLRSLWILFFLNYLRFYLFVFLMILFMWVCFVLCYFISNNLKYD